MNFCKIHQLGVSDYEMVWELQKTLFAEILDAKRKNVSFTHHLIMVEHPHVYTFGKHAQHHHLLATADMLRQVGAKVFEIERGGDITYHGPGQLVVYPIFDLESLHIGLKTYVQGLETCIMNTLKHYHIASETISDRVGVWLDKGKPSERKIAAIGIKSSRYVTMHGLALNVNTDLHMFQHIVPCGIPDKAVTSMAKELNEEIDFLEVKKYLEAEFSAIFGLTFL